MFFGMNMKKANKPKTHKKSIFKQEDIVSTITSRMETQEAVDE